MGPIERAFRVAAEILHNSHYKWSDGVVSHYPACNCVVGTLSTTRPALLGFAEVFRPNGIHHYDLWFGPTAGIKEHEILHHQNHRVFALLFMAELAKDQGI